MDDPKPLLSRLREVPGGAWRIDPWLLSQADTEALSAQLIYPYDVPRRRVRRKAPPRQWAVQKLIEYLTARERERALSGADRPTEDERKQAAKDDGLKFNDTEWRMALTKDPGKRGRGRPNKSGAK